MAPLERGVLVDFARLGGLAHRQRLIESTSKAEPALFLAQPCQRRAGQRIEGALAIKAAAARQAVPLPAPTFNAPRAAVRAFGIVLEALLQNTLHFVTIAALLQRRDHLLSLRVRPLRRPIDGDRVVGAQRGHPPAGPAVTIASDKAISIKNAGDQIIVGDQHEVADGSDDVRRGAVALTPAPPWQTQCGMDAAHSVDDKNDLGGLSVDIGDNLADDGADNALFEPRAGRWGAPDGLEIAGQGGR